MPSTTRTFVLAAALALFAAAAFAVSPVNSNWRGVAIHGYDPVAYFTDGKPVEGKSDITFDWQGATWRFASVEHQKAFAATPEKYAPQYGGYCAFAVAKNSTKTSSPPGARTRRALSRKQTVSGHR